MTNAERMKSFRRIYGLNTKQAGRVFGLTGRAIENIEQGIRRPNDKILALALKNITYADVDLADDAGAVFAAEIDIERG